MKLYIDGGKTDAAPLNEVETVEEALEALREKGLLGERQVVLDVHVDGHSCAEQPGRLSDPIRLDGAETVKVQTGTHAEYAEQVLQDAKEVSTFLQRAAGEVANSFRTGTPEDSNGMLYRLLDSVHTLLQVLRCAEKSCGAQDATLVEDGGQLGGRIQETLRRIEKAQTQEDWPRLAEHLEGDLVETLETLRHAVTRIEQEIQENDD